MLYSWRIYFIDFSMDSQIDGCLVMHTYISIYIYIVYKRFIICKQKLSLSLSLIRAKVDCDVVIHYVFPTRQIVI